MKQEVKIGQTDYTVLILIRDTAGAPKTGLTNASAGIDVCYTRVETDNDVVLTAGAPVALATPALTDVHLDWGFLQVDATNAPGLYRLDIADGVFATGAWSAVVSLIATGIDPCQIEFVLVPESPYTGVNVSQWLGTACAAVTTGGVPEVDVTYIAGAAVNTATAQIGTNVVTQANIDFGALQKTSLNAATPASVVGAVGSVTGAVGSVAGAVGSVTGNVGGNVVGSAASVVGAVGSVTGAVGSVTGAVGSVTAGVTVTTNNDKTGYGLSAAAVQAVWDALLTALTTAGSIGKKLADWVVGTIDTYTDNTKQTGDTFARLGAPIAASISADIAVVDANVDTLLTRVTAAVYTAWTKLADVAMAGTEAAGSLIKRVYDNLDAAISSRSTYAGGAVASVTGNVGGNVVGSVASVVNIPPTGTGLTALGDARIANLDAAISTRLAPAGTVAACTLVNGLAANVITAASMAADAGTEIAAAVWDEVLTAAQHNIATSAGRKIRELTEVLVISQGTAQAGSNTTLTLAAGESAVNDYYKGMVIVLLSGTGAGQARACTGYNGGTKVVTIGPAWATNPAINTEYSILSFGATVVAAIDNIDFGATMKASIETACDASVGGGTGTSLTAIPWNAAWDAEVESEANDALVANHLDHLLAVDYDPAAKPGIATALLNELVENDAGVSRYTANALELAPSGGASAAAVADAVWDEAIADHLGAGSTGKIIGDNLPVPKAFHP